LNALAETEKKEKKVNFVKAKIAVEIYLGFFLIGLLTFVIIDKTTEVKESWLKIIRKTCEI